MTQEGAANYFGVSMRQYKAWEADRKKPPVKIKKWKLEPYEVCVIYRHRAKMSVNRLALDIGFSPYWVTRLERGREPGAIGTLLEYWEC